MFSLKNKRVLVTGGAAGIGAAICSAVSRQGGTVWVADVDFKAATQRAKQIGGETSNVFAIELDVTDGKACQDAAEHVGDLDVLINNAGVGCVGTLVETSDADFDRMYDVNVRGIFNVCKAFLPAMLAKRSGNVINVASIAGVIGLRDRLAYTTSKFAVVGMTKAMALDHASENIRVNCICPARVETDFVTKRLSEYPDPEAARKEMSSTQLFGRMITPDEVAAAAVYLASDESYMVTGSDFRIDCGWTTG